jgi:hypothetical protein
MYAERDPRAAFYALRWQRHKLHPTEALRMAVHAGLTDPEDQDHGQLAGDTIMQLAADRGLDVEGSPFESAMHHAALADLIVTVLRDTGPSWGHPVDVDIHGAKWQSGAYVEPSGVRLRRVLLLNRWSFDRKNEETHSWRSLGEVCAYRLPMTMTVVLLGQSRDGKHHGPWSKGFLHPIARTLRIRKRSGQSFNGYKTAWREEMGNISRDKWLDTMKADGVMPDILFDVNVEVPFKETVSKIRQLAATKLRRIQKMEALPELNPSACWGITPCMFLQACWSFQEPSERLGFTPLTQIRPLPEPLPQDSPVEVVE